MDDSFTKNTLLLLDLPEQLESERIYLRVYQQGEGEEFYDILQNNREHLKDVVSEVKTIKNVKEAEIRNRQLYANWVSRIRFVLPIREKRSDAMIGEIWIEPIDKDLEVYELGYFIIKSKEGQGYVTEAAQLALKFIFHQLHASKVEIRTDETNERSYKVAERLGFTREGLLRNRAKTNDEIMGRLYYGLLSSEFESQ